MSVTKKVLATVRNTIKKHNMLEDTYTVVVGVSGGADSVMLLHCLNKLKEEFGFKIFVAHVNHKIRKGSAERDAEFVRNLCKEMGVEFFLKEAYVKDIAKQTGKSEEEVGREIRYQFFSDLAGCTGKIATAHNKNDVVETVLMRFMRGTGIKGLCGIPYTRDNIIRPILDLSRQEIEEYLKENNLTHITDETNLESVYTRNKIRLDLIPYIQKEFNPNLINTVADNVSLYREDVDYFEQEVDRLYQKCVSQQNDTFIIDLITLREQHPSISKRLILKSLCAYLKVQQLGFSYEVVNSIYEGLNSQVGTIFTINEEYLARISYNNLLFERREDKMLNTVVFDYKFGELDEDFVYYPELNLKLDYSNVYEMNIINTPEEFFLPFEEYEGKTLEIRTRRDGDVFRVEDGVHKNLNKIFIDKKIDNKLRDNIPLLCNGNEVLCAIGYFVTRYKNRTGKFMKVRVL